LVAVLGPLPAFGEVGQRLEFVGPDLEQRTGARQALGEADIDTAPSLRLPADIVPAFRPATDDVTHDVAIDADAVDHVGGLVDQRFLRQALGDGRQRAGIDILGLDPLGLMVLGQRLVLEDVGDADKGRRSLRVEGRRVGRGRWLNGLRLCCQD
jgi:hypothetical protein